MRAVATTSRRGLLRRGALAAGGLLGLAVGAGSAGAAIPDPSRSAARRETLRLVGEGWYARTHGLRRGQLPGVGDRVLVTGALRAVSGADLGGDFTAVCFACSEHGIGASGGSSLELHTFRLPAGILLGMGGATADASVNAVVGGTGRYAGARGTYALSQRPLGLGGDGSAELVFDLELAS